MREGFGEKGYVYVWLRSFLVHLKLPQHCILQYKIRCLKFKKKRLKYITEIQAKYYWDRC